MNAHSLTLAAVFNAAIISATSAKPVLFVNPEGRGRHLVHTFPETGSYEFVDISKPASQQPAPRSDPNPGSALTWSYNVDEFGKPDPSIFLGHVWDANLIAGTTLGLMEGNKPVTQVAILQFGDIVGSIDTFKHYVGFGVLSSSLPGDSTGFLGVRFAIWNDAGTNFTTHFGWIQVDWLGQGLFGGVDLDLLAWGYETEPDTPIAAGAGLPAPGAAGLFAVAGAIAAQRRRRG